MLIGSDLWHSIMHTNRRGDEERQCPATSGSGNSTQPSAEVQAHSGSLAAASKRTAEAVAADDAAAAKEAAARLAKQQHEMSYPPEVVAAMHGTR